MPLKDVRKIVYYWLSSANKDWIAAQVLRKQKLYVHALIAGHLALEKYIKAVIVRQTREHSAYGHDLLYLLGKTNLAVEKEDLDILRTIGNFQSQGRYPDWELKFYDLVNQRYAKYYFKQMERLRKWFKSELSKKS